MKAGAEMSARVTGEAAAASGPEAVLLSRCLRTAQQGPCLSSATGHRKRSRFRHHLRPTEVHSPRLTRNDHGSVII
jgi:hypothetical protein